MPLDYVVNRLSEVRGHVVRMPLHYLEKEELIAGGVNLSVNVVTGTSSFLFTASEFVRGYLHVRKAKNTLWTEAIIVFLKLK